MKTLHSGSSSCPQPHSKQSAWPSSVQSCVLVAWDWQRPNLFLLQQSRQPTTWLQNGVCGACEATLRWSSYFENDQVPKGIETCSINTTVLFRTVATPLSCTESFSLLRCSGAASKWCQDNGFYPPTGPQRVLMAAWWLYSPKIESSLWPTSLLSWTDLFYGPCSRGWHSSF